MIIRNVVIDQIIIRMVQDIASGADYHKTFRLQENTLYLLESDRINFIFIVRSKTLLRLIK